MEPSADETATVPPLTPPLPLAVKPMELLVSPDSQNNNRAEGGGDQQTLSSQQDSSVDQRVTTTRLYADGLLFLSTVDHSMPECSDAPLVSDNLSSVCDLLPSVSSVKLLTGDSAGPISFTVTSEPPVPSGAELLQQQLNVCLSCLQIFPSVEVLTGHGELKHNASGILPRTNDWPSAMLFEDSDGPKLRFLRASLQSSCPDDSEAVSATTSQQNSMTSGCDDPTSPTALRQPDGLEPDLKRPEVPISPEELARNLKLASEMSASRILQQKAVRQANFQQFGSFDRTPTPCQLHPEGKSAGVECPKCEMVLGSSRSLGGHITMMHSRNSCKTLKCPKCNWHYKYQETLEIHMKEKHPENDVSCIYCLTNQSHPRLARGETYGCGYKPYRCDICKYSTTTKGNLSIHMQSDKHLNNVQELQVHLTNGSTTGM